MPELTGDRLHQHLHDLSELRLGCYSERRDNLILEPARFGQQPGIASDADRFPEAAVTAWASKKKISPRNDSPGTLYRPIFDPYEIRVLEIKPGSNDDSICCTLHHCSLECRESHREVTPKSELMKSAHVTVPQNKFGLLMDDLVKPIWYTALSYTWGPGAFDMPINVDGHEKLITKSLYGVLQHLRPSGHSVVL